MRRLGYLAPLMWLGVVAYGSVGWGQSSVLDRFTAEQRKTLLAGEQIYLPEIETGATVEKFTARSMIVIDKPVEYCFRMFSRFEDQRHYFPRIVKSEVISRSKNRVVIYKEADIGVTTLSYTHILSVDQANHRVDFVTDPSGKNDVKFSKGFFQFEKIDENRTLFTYGLTEFDPGLDLPEFIRNYFAKRDLPGMVVNLKKWIESEGKWTKEE